MPHGIKKSFLTLSLLLLVGLCFASSKIILKTDETPAQLYEERAQLKTAGIQTVILDELSLNWNEEPEILREQRKTLNALKNNEMQIYMQINLTESLPKWDTDWTGVNQNLQSIIQEAKSAGIRGVIINTDTGHLSTRAYNPRHLWRPEYNPRYVDISDHFAEQIIYQCGREFMQTIEKTYPEIEVAIYPVGPAEPVTPNYTYWHHFVNGMASTGSKTKLKLIANAVTPQNLQTAQERVEDLLDNKTLPILPLYPRNAAPVSVKVLENLDTGFDSYILPMRFADLQKLQQTD